MGASMVHASDPAKKDPPVKRLCVEDIFIDVPGSINEDDDKPDPPPKGSAPPGGRSPPSVADPVTNVIYFSNPAK